MGVGLKPQQTNYKPMSGKSGLLQTTSPAFHAGAGNFREHRRPGVLGLEHLEHRRVVAQVGQAVVFAAPTLSKKPPPATDPVTYKPFLVEKSVMRDVEINIEVLPDKTLSEKGKKAVTTISGLPAYNIRHEHMNGKIVRYFFKWKGTIKIQTVFPSNILPNDESGYGRGTGPDVPAGNVSLGFHESCHRNDFMAYISKSDELATTGKFTPYVLPESDPEVAIRWQIVKFPRFSGDVGQTVAVFNARANSFEQERKKWSSDIIKFSAHCTDEFGHTKSAHQRGSSAGKHRHR